MANSLSSLFQKSMLSFPFRRRKRGGGKRDGMDQAIALTSQRRRLSVRARRKRTVARLRDGWAYDGTAREARLAVERVREIVEEVPQVRRVAIGPMRARPVTCEPVALDLRPHALGATRTASRLSSMLRPCGDRFVQAVLRHPSGPSWSKPGGQDEYNMSNM